jgi:CMP-N-acetylneuraminic acid synthetase
MLKVETVQEVIDRIITEKIEFGESVKEFNNWLFEHYGKYIITPEFDKMSTKSLKLYYQPAHAFRVFDKNYFLETGDMSIEFFPTLFPISEEESVDIDTELDFKIAKVIYNERKINKKI